MEIRCELLNTDIPVEVCEDGVCLISHKTIRDIVLKHPRIQVETTPKKLDPYMCVVECVARDTETGVSVLEIGESNPNNLEGAISKKYPATLAYQRAEDRAVIALLGLGKKVYSNLEIENAAISTQSSETKKEIAPPMADEYSLNDIAPANLNEDVPPDMDNDASNNKAVVDSNAPADGIGTVSSVSISDNLVISFGNCRGKKYGDVKNSPQFETFLRWCLQNKPKFKDERNIQAELFTALATEVLGQPA